MWSEIKDVHMHKIVKDGVEYSHNWKNWQIEPPEGCVQLYDPDLQNSFNDDVVECHRSVIVTVGKDDACLAENLPDGLFDSCSKVEVFRDVLGNEVVSIGSCQEPFVYENHIIRVHPEFADQIWAVGQICADNNLAVITPGYFPFSGSVVRNPLGFSDATLRHMAVQRFYDRRNPAIFLVTTDLKRFTFLVPTIAPHLMWIDGPKNFLQYLNQKDS